MLMNSCRPKATASCISIAILCLLLSACAGGYYTTKVNGGKQVYRVGKQGEKTLVYEVDQNGQTTIHNPDDPTAKRHVAAQERAEQLRTKQAEQLEILREAPKRHAQDPIYVNLSPPVLDGKVQKAERSKGAVAEQIRKELTADPIIKLVDDHQQAQGPLKLRTGQPVADVDVSSKVSMKEVYGLNRKTGKPGKMVAVVFEATITSQVLPASYTVSESGSIFQNVEVSKRFARQVKQVILEKIGPDIPAH
jgi:hypothetical protein